MSGARYLTERALLERFAVPRTTWNRWRREGYVPQPVRVGPRAIRWLASEIEAFERRLADDRGVGAA